MRKVAIPISNNRLSEFFGESSFCEVFELDGDKIQRNIVEIPSDTDSKRLAEWVEKQGVTDVIVYKVKKEIIMLFASKKINLFVGIPPNSTKEIVEAYLNGKLESDKNIIEEITK